MSPNDQTVTIYEKKGAEFIKTQTLSEVRAIAQCYRISRHRSTPTACVASTGLPRATRLSRAGRTATPTSGSLRHARAVDGCHV